MTTTPRQPGDEPTDVAFDRVRAADPAAGLEPDLGRLAAGVAEHRERADQDDVVPEGLEHGLGSDVESGRESAGAVPAVRGDELGARRNARRPARWLQAAAAVAAVALVGGGGYALGQTGDDSTLAAPISLGAAAGAGSSVGMSDAAVADTAAPESASSKMMGGYGNGGRTIFTGSGLSTEAGTGDAWGFDPAAVFSSETARRIADVLGVTGEPVQQWGAWVVGPTDGTGPTVQLQGDGLASVSYYDPTRDPWACAVAPVEPGIAPDGAATQDEAAEAEKAAADPLYGCEPTTAGERPSDDDAISVARDTMQALDVDLERFSFSVENGMADGRGTFVTAAAVQDGQLIGLSWSFTVVSDGVQSLYGSFAPLVQLGSFDLISPADAVARLSDPRFGASWGGIMPIAGGGQMRILEDAVTTMETVPEGATSTREIAPEPTLPPTPVAGAAIPWPVSSVTLTGSRLGLGLTSLPNGATVLLPSYELTAADGSAWNVVALADAALDFAPAG